VNPQQLLERLSALRGSLTNAQLASLAGAFTLAVGLVVGSAYWLNAPTYRLLFADMDAESASQVADRLRSLDVPYQLTDGGRSVRVPESQIDQLRIDFASQGLPVSGRIGFEIFDRTAFGQTEFLEQVNYRRALEGEIARTIATIAEVEGARVHIAMARDSVFSARQQPAKASVVVKLRKDRPLSTASVSGITSLVAASVEGLRPESVVIVDSFGRPLSPRVDDANEPLGSAQIERQQRYERELAERVVALLEPVVGVDRVRVNVAARINLDSEDQIEERYEPAGVIRSRTVTLEGGAGAALAQGIAGARANLPGAVEPGADQPSSPSLAPAAATTAVAGPTRSAETTNYELSKVVRHTVRPRGDIARISVAVILDDQHVAQKGDDGRVSWAVTPREPAEVQKLHGLVAAAVGLDPTRGDQLTVENIGFGELLEDDPPVPGWFERFGPQLNELGRIFAVIVLGGLAFAFVGRPLVRRALPVASASRVEATVLPPHQLPRTIEELEGEIEAKLDMEAAARQSDRKMPVLTKRITSLAQKEPESAARLIRTWLIEDKK
jgi:flagellar M-ring protein FliF